MIAPAASGGRMKGASPFIVGVGASAGGIEALEGMFRNVPAEGELAFVIVAHLAAGRESALPEIIARFAAAPVSAARDGEKVEPNHIYVVTPGTLLTIRRGRLHAAKLDPLRHERHPIDVFLTSLAEDQHERAIGVILSGGGSDGALGIKAIKERGGLTVAQGADTTAPRYPGMPASAIATGVVDLVLPAQDIVGKLADYARRFRDTGELAAAGAGAVNGEVVSEARQAICTILRDQVGHDFNGYKERTFLRRVQRRMQVLQLGEIEAYVERLRQDPDEVMLLFRDLLIGVTSFFRDPEAFDAVETTVLPKLFDGKGAGDTIRVWVPGCATGEEVYSLAMLLRERVEEQRAAPKVQLFATDIDGAALEVARSGRYPATLVDAVSPERLRRFFTTDGATYVCGKQVRDMCVFSSHSVIRDPPFSRIDLVSCRNLLIYLDAEMQSRLIPVFHYALRPGGFLFLGSAENVTQYGNLFVPVEKKHRIFQRRDHVSAPIHFPMFLPGLRLLGPAGGHDRGEGAGAGISLRRTVEMRVLERFAPAHVVVNRECDVVFYSQRTGKYLEAAAGQPSRALLGMARKGLRLDLRSALHEAVETRRPVSREGILVDVDDHVQVVDLAVELLPQDDKEPLFLVLFTDVGPLLTREQLAAQGRGITMHDTSTLQLERELRDTRERLQGTIEEYETALEELKSANEELVSVNEELQSTNEELETSKEEIQSVNEELHTVNQELAAKVDELNQANNDLRNLFESTRIAIVFLDRHLVIRSFTPEVTKLFSLIPTDRGRPLSDIASQIDHPGLHDEIRNALQAGTVIERRVAQRGGRAHYLMRVLPYRAGSSEIDGVIVTLVDITAVVAGEQQLRTLVHELNHRVRNMLSIIGAIARQTLAHTSAPGEFASVFLGRVDAMGAAYGLVAREQWGDVALREILRGQLEPYLLDGLDRARLEGPPASLPPRAALALGLVVHELVTNAVKHGALSVAGGRVEVAWRLDEKAERPRVTLVWKEMGGPPVRPPERRGFGSELIEREVAMDLRGKTTLEYLPNGLLVTLAFPLPAAPVM